MGWFPFMGWAPEFLSPLLLLGVLCRKKKPVGRPKGKQDSYKRRRRKKYDF